MSTENAPLCLPDMHGEKNRVPHTIYEYEDLLDRTNMQIDDWIRIAQDVKETYESFDGFVILHGRDTMPYTASALSFVMEHLGKAVVITGSQIPFFEARSDGRDNFLGALILRGNTFCLLRISPLITLEAVKVKVYLQTPTQGVVLHTYGAGNFPTNRTDLLDELRIASKRGVLIMNCTQCGHVSAIYETGALLLETGVIAGWDMTPESALCKLSYVIGRNDWGIEKKRDMLITNLSTIFVGMRT